MEMYRTFKLKVKPTKEQEEIFFKSANVARYAYNWALNRHNEIYEESKGKVSAYGLITEYNRYKHQEGNEWLLEVSQRIPQRAILDLEEAFNLFFKGAAQYPRFHSYRATTPSFFVRTDGIRFTQNKVKFEKLGFVKYSGRVDEELKFYNGRCKYDGDNWYLTLNYKTEVEKSPVEVDVIGIDLGITTLATTSLGDKYENINKTPEMVRLYKKRNRLTRGVSRKYRMNNKPKEFRKTRNIVKENKKIKRIYNKERNKRVNHIRHIVKDILANNPGKIVMEDLAIKNLSKNKNLSTAINNSLWGEFIKHMESKCEKQGIEFVKADRTFPSSKKCSSCGDIKKNLKLSERTYVCAACGLNIDRDLNAAINLKKYKNQNQKQKE